MRREDDTPPDRGAFCSEVDVLMNVVKLQKEQ